MNKGSRTRLVAVLELILALVLITNGSALGQGQQPAGLGPALPANLANLTAAATPTPGVPVTFQATVPPVSALVTSACPCVQITADRDKHTLIAANRCSDVVSLLGARDKKTLPFVPITPSSGREFANVQVPRTDYVEFVGLTPFTSFNVLFLSCPGTTSAPPVLRCLVDFDQVAAGMFAPPCDVSGKALGDACTCPIFRGASNPPVAVGTGNGQVTIFPPAPPN